VAVSTSMNRRSETRTPASSRPRSSVSGRRPIATRTWSTSIFSAPPACSNGTTMPSRLCSSVPTRASGWMPVPRRASARPSTSATSRSGPMGSTPCGSASSRVVCTPRSVNTEANSAPITPPPMTATRSGRASRSLLVAWSEVMIRSPSISMPGRERGTEPAQMITARPLSVWSPTATVPSAVSRPRPSTTVTLRRRSRPDRPLCSWPTIPALRALTAGQSVVACTPSGSRKPKSPECLTARNTSAACNRALAGMQPRCRQQPPTLFSSTSAMERPAEAPYRADA